VPETPSPDFVKSSAMSMEAVADISPKSPDHVGYPGGVVFVLISSIGKGRLSCMDLVPV